MKRISQKDYFMKIAETVALRSTCDRAYVGAVIVKDKNIISTGYNGNVSGEGHCLDEGHIMIGGHCWATVHAEQNAICQAAKNGHSIKDSEIYCTHKPCSNCMKLLINSGVKKIYFKNKYEDPAQERYEKLFEVLECVE